MGKVSSDRIERQVLLRALRVRVWQAISNAEEFRRWFGVALAGKSFVAGRHTQGHITYPGYEHLLMEVAVERVDPERLLSWRWHPYAIDPAVDYSKETPTLVEFELKEADGGTLLRVTESGFEGVPELRRAEAYRMNNGGWEQQMKNIEKHVKGP